MRIIDWSSDVCSSDLPICWPSWWRNAGRATGEAGAVRLLRARDGRRGLPAVDRRRWRRDAAGRRPDADAAARTAHEPDRKSVVKGQGVSSPIDLCRGLILKKKKPRNTLTKLTI